MEVSTTYRKSTGIIQLGSFLLLLTAAGLYYSSSFRNDAAAGRYSLGMILPPEALVDPPAGNWLFDLADFRYELNSVDVCSDGDAPFFMAVVHSKPEHFRQRQVIRKTWASADRRLVRAVFLLGTVIGGVDGVETQRLVAVEHAEYGDVVQGNFVDDYRNLTLKNVMGLKWMGRHCSAADFFLKSDDDVFIDVAQLKRFFDRTFGVKAALLPANSVVCSVQPRGSKIQRQGKWAVNWSDRWGMSMSHYPSYCAGLAYVMRPALAGKLLAAARSLPFFWIDDVYVTGLLVAAVQARHFSLNLRYTHKHEELLEWLESEGDVPKPLPFIVSELDTSTAQWPSIAVKLWNRTETLFPPADLL